MTRFATRVVHAGLDPDPAFGGVVPPIHQASTYVQKAVGEADGSHVKALKGALADAQQKMSDEGA